MLTSDPPLVHPLAREATATAKAVVISMMIPEGQPSNRRLSTDTTTGSSWQQAPNCRVALYPGMRSMGASDQRLYWTRVLKSFAAVFADKSRAAWAEAAAAGARTTAVRQGKRTPRQHAEATIAIKSIDVELKPRLPRSARGPGVKRLDTSLSSAFGTTSSTSATFGIGAPKSHLATRHVRASAWS